MEASSVNLLKKNDHIGPKFPKLLIYPPFFQSCWTWNYLQITSRLKNYFYSRVENSLYSLIFSSSHKSYSKYELSLDPPRVEFMQSIPRLISWEGFNTLPKVRGDTVLETWRRLDGAGRG